MSSKTKKATPLPVARLTAPDFILALDMSLAHTGYALVNLTTGEISKGLIEPKNLRGMERLAFLRTNVLMLAANGHPEWRDQPAHTCVTDDGGTALRTCQACQIEKGQINCLVLIEGYAFGARGQAVISLGELGGAIRLALWESRIPYLEIPPTQVKKFVAGKGNVQKDIVLKEVYKRFGEDIDDNNIADAYALMQLGLAVVGRNPKPLVQFQEQVVSEVLKSVAKETPVAA